MQDASQQAIREPSKLITCLLPDDGTHSTLLNALRRETRIIKTEVFSCLAVGNVADSTIKPSTLPDTSMARIVRIVVPEAEADTLFDFVYKKARIGRKGGGAVLMNTLVTSTVFTLPEGVAEEDT